MRALVVGLSVSLLVMAFLFGVADLGWQMSQTGGPGKWFDVHFLSSRHGWDSIKNDHPTVKKSPFGLSYAVITSEGSYTTNLSLDPQVDAELGRLAVQ